MDYYSRFCFVVNESNLIIKSLIHDRSIILRYNYACSGTIFTDQIISTTSNMNLLLIRRTQNTHIIVSFIRFILVCLNDWQIIFDNCQKRGKIDILTFRKYHTSVNKVNFYFEWFLIYGAIQVDNFLRSVKWYILTIPERSKSRLLPRNGTTTEQT